MANFVMILNHPETRRLRDTINNSTGICTTDTLGKQPIPATYCKIFDCTLRTIIINAQMPIIQVPAKIVFLIQRI